MRRGNFGDIKFRLGGKYGQENLDRVLEKLVEKEVLNRFEFNNNVNYKSKEDIPLNLGGATARKVAAPAPSVKQAAPALVV